MADQVTHFEIHGKDAERLPQFEANVIGLVKAGSL